MILEVRNLKKYFETRKGLLNQSSYTVKAVDGVNFEVRQGEALGIVGESGCGKTTTGRLILHLITPSSGDVLFKGRSIYAFSREELKEYRRNVQLIFQDSFASLDPRMRVGEIVGEALDVHRIAHTRNEREEIIVRIFSDVGLDREWIRRYPHEFSGGQRQRIGIARALCLKPALIVCDEPVSALDVSIQAQILNLMKEIQRKYQLSYVFISHDLKVVKHVCDRVAVMYLGMNVEMCGKESLFASPLHPYTKALISVIPNPNPRIKRKKITLGGEANLLAADQGGCRFADRCSEVKERCRQESPELVEVKKDHFVACHLAGIGG